MYHYRLFSITNLEIFITDTAHRVHAVPGAPAGQLRCFSGCGEIPPIPDIHTTRDRSRVYPLTNTRFFFVSGTLPARSSVSQPRRKCSLVNGSATVDPGRSCPATVPAPRALASPLSPGDGHPDTGRGYMAPRYPLHRACGCHKPAPFIRVHTDRRSGSERRN
jgi:hypothetical protein